jgi:hypothetical protein
MSTGFILLPLFSFFGSGLFGRYFGRKFSCFFPILCIFISFVSGLFISYEVFLSSTKIAIYL